MLPTIALNDTDPTIGQPRIVVSNPFIALAAETATLQDLRDLIVQLASSHLTTVNYIARLEERIDLLESRTWWSLLKAQVISWLHLNKS